MEGPRRDHHTAIRFIFGDGCDSCLHVHRLRYGPNRQLNIEDRGNTRVHLHILVYLGSETSLFRFDQVGGNGQVEGDISAVTCCGQRPTGIGLGICDRDSHALYGGPRRTFLDAALTGADASWCDDNEGGIFTRSLAEILDRPVKNLDSNGDGFVTWAESSLLILLI